MVNNDLQHHGVKGMKWGQHIFGKIKTARAKRLRKKNLEKAREAKKVKADEAAERKKAIESGTADDVLKYKGKLTNKELSDAYTRLNYERLLSDISSKETQSNMDKVGSLLSKAETAVSYTGRTLDAYNKSAKIINALSKADLPTFDGNMKTKAVESAMDRLIKSGSAADIEKHFGKLSGKQLAEVNVRFTNEDKIRERAAKDKATADAQRQVNDYYNNVYLGKNQYNKSGKDIVDSILNTKSSSKTSGDTSVAALLEDKSSGNGVIALGQTRIAGLLEDKSGG